MAGSATLRCGLARLDERQFRAGTDSADRRDGAGCRRAVKVSFEPKRAWMFTDCPHNHSCAELLQSPSSEHDKYGKSLC